MSGSSTRLPQRKILIAIIHVILAALIIGSFPRLNSYLNVRTIRLSRETADETYFNKTLQTNTGSMHKIIRQNETDWAEKSRAIYARLPDIQQFAATQPSPVCRPNLNAALPDWRWDNSTKFERIYFYHARKAGGTSLAQYFKEVAKYHGLEFVADEWNAAEEPGHNNVSGASTFYVTHLREPVDRAISHFKCMFDTTILYIIHILNMV